jgi:hypothetical protein
LGKHLDDVAGQHLTRNRLGVVHLVNGVDHREEDRCRHWPIKQPRFATGVRPRQHSLERCDQALLAELGQLSCVFRRERRQIRAREPGKAKRRLPDQPEGDSGELCREVRRGRCDCLLDARTVALEIAPHHLHEQLFFALRDVIIEGSLTHTEALGDVLQRDGRIPALAEQPLGNPQQLLA